MFKQVEQQLNTVYQTLQQKMPDYNDIPAYIICGDIGRESSYYSMQSFITRLQVKRIFSPRYRFVKWLELRDYNTVADFGGNELQTLHQWYQHMLLSEHKSNGMFVIYIPENNSEITKKADIIGFAKQICQLKGNVLFVIVTSPKKGQLLHDNILFSVMHDCGTLSNTEMIYYDIWESLSAEEKEMMITHADILNKDDAVKILKWTLKAHGYINNRKSIETVIKEMSDKKNTVGNGIGFSM